MTIAYPPWALNNLTPLNSQTTSKRNEWLARSLRLRRIFQVIKHAKISEIEIYYEILGEFLTVSKPYFEEGSVIWEIVSDGLGVEEPEWNGFKVHTDGIEDLSSEALNNYTNNVHRFRTKNSHALGSFKTHRDIGELLSESVLFKVTEEEVFYYNNFTWVSLSTYINFDILINELESVSIFPISWRSAMSKEELSKLRSESKEKIEAIYLSDFYKENIKKIRDSLLLLSKKVLWPALLNYDNIENGSFTSLVLINSSSWPIGSSGVWAMHAYIPQTRSESNNLWKSTNSIMNIISPPKQCLDDLFDHIYRTGLQPGLQIGYVNLYIVATRGYQLKTKFLPSNYESDVKKVAESLLQKDPIIAIEYIFKSTVTFFTKHHIELNITSFTGKYYCYFVLLQRVFVILALDYLEAFPRLQNLSAELLYIKIIEFNTIIFSEDLIQQSKKNVVVLELNKLINTAGEDDFTNSLRIKILVIAFFNQLVTKFIYVNDVNAKTIKNYLLPQIYNLIKIPDKKTKMLTEIDNFITVTTEEHSNQLASELYVLKTHLNEL